MDRHSFFDDPLHPAKTDPKLVLDQFAHRTDPTIAKHIDIVCFANSIHDIQVIAKECINIGDRNSMPVSEWIIADDLDDLLIFIDDLDFLTSRANEPNIHFLFAKLLVKSELVRVVDAIWTYPHLIARNDQFHFMIDHILSIRVRDPTHREQTLSIVHHRIEVFFVERNWLSDDTRIDLDFFHMLFELVDILLGQDSAFFEQCSEHIDIFGKDTTYKTCIIACRDRHDILFMELGTERIRNHISSFREDLLQLVSLVPMDMKALLHHHIAINIHDIRSQRVVHHSSIRVEFFLQLITSSLREIITAMIEKLRLHQSDRTIKRWDLVASLVFIKRKKRFFCRFDFIVQQRVFNFFVFSKERVIQHQIQVHVFSVFLVFRHMFQDLSYRKHPRSFPSQKTFLKL